MVKNSTVAHSVFVCVVLRTVNGDYVEKLHQLAFVMAASRSLRGMN